jgi:hypothetical protein
MEGIGVISYGPPVGPGMSIASPAEVADALRTVPSPEDWAAMAPGLLPAFERRRPFAFDVGRPLTALVPPGVSVAIVYDFGPGLLRVTRELAELWSVSEREVVERAMANLRSRVTAALSTPGAIRIDATDLDGLPVRGVISHEGWASALLLLPDVLGRVFGREPCIFVAPMRDLLLAMPAAVDIGLATRWTEGFEALDPNCLCLEAFAWDGETLSIRVLDRGAAVA